MHFNSYGQIGDGTVGDATNKLYPYPVNNSGVLQGLKILQISLGIQHTCALANDNNIYCWGDNK
jgi:alpha-tubulin suppressor-like RCC1 family protein